MSDSEYDSPKVVFGDKDNKHASLLSIFARSARYEGRFLQHHSWDYVTLMWLPLLTILSVWWIFSRPYIVDLPIGVIDHSKSSYSRVLIRNLDATPDLNVTRNYANMWQAKEDILATEIYAVVVIPDDFASQINKGAPSSVVLKVNAQYGTHSGIIQRSVQSVVGTVSAAVKIQRAVKEGSYSQQARISYSPIGVERVSLFNIGANYQQFLASTVIPALLHILAMIIGATTIGREVRDKTLSVWYNTITHPDMPYPDFKRLKHIPPNDKLAYIHANLHQSWQNPQDYTALKGLNYTYLSMSKIDLAHSYLNKPRYQYNLTFNKTIKPRMPAKVSIIELVFGLNGKLIWALLFYMLWGALALTMALSAHPASMASYLVVYVAFIALTMISLWLGAIFSLTSYSLRMGLSSTAFVSAPSFAFAGVTFPLLAMSEGAQRWANVLPLTHYLKIHIGQLQMSAPTYVALPTLFGLLAAVIVTLVITALLCLRAFKNPDRWGAR